MIYCSCSCKSPVQTTVGDRTPSIMTADSVSISAARATQIDSVMRKFVASFLKPIDSTEDFVSIFHPEVEWYDHAFLIRRVGHTAVMGLHKGFTYCNQPFDVKIKVGSSARSVYLT